MGLCEGWLAADQDNPRLFTEGRISEYRNRDSSLGKEHLTRNDIGGRYVIPSEPFDGLRVNAGREEPGQALLALKFVSQTFPLQRTLRAK